MRRMKKLIEKVLEGITSVEFVILLLAMSAADSPDLTPPFILGAQALAWICIVGRYLGWFDEDYDLDGLVENYDEEESWGGRDLCGRR